MKNMRRRVFALLFLSLAVRVVMPAGYMPGSIGEGHLFVLCPGGSYGTSYFATQSAGEAQHGEHHHHTHGAADTAGPELDAWQHCPFGAVFSPAIDVSEVFFSFPPRRDANVPETTQAAELPAVAQVFHARAPPSTRPALI